MLVKALNKMIYLNHPNKFWYILSSQPKLGGSGGRVGGRQGERRGHLTNV